MATARPLRSDPLHDALARTREVIARSIAPYTDAVDRDARWPEEGIRGMLAAGLGGLVVERASNGWGLGLHAIARVCEEIAMTCPSSAISFGMHCVGAAVIQAKATEDHRERYLRPIARGEHLTTLALSEPGTGSHFYFPQTRAARTDEGYVLSGTKAFVTSGGHADSYVLSIAGDPGTLPGEFSCVVVRADREGMVWGPPWNGLGMRGNSSRTLELRDVRVHRGDLLGEEGDELWYVFEVIAPYFLMAMSGTYLGIARAALEEARYHLRDRVHAHTGRPLGAEPLLQHRFGEMWAQVERTRQLIYHGARAIEAGDSEDLPALLSAKAEVAECAVAVVNDALTIAGGVGYGEGARLGRMLRDARAAHVMAPSTDLLRIWVGRELLGMPLLGDE